MAKISTDTIVAIATPLGQGGLGVVRLSGPASLSIASSLFFNSSTKILNAPSHTLHHGWVGTPEKKIDEAVLSLFKTPHSYTGEDVVEISCHGSPVILKEIVDLCQTKGARLARPGEFTQRAFLNGKIDLAQAEAVADLISAGSSRARQVATDQLRGELSKRIQLIREPLLDLLAHMEANLDFAEEEIPNLPYEELRTGLQKIVQALAELLSTHLKGKRIREGLRVALIGRPNVGKSSLFNALLAQDRAIVTNVPGTTRDTIEETMEWNNQAVVLIDTAGLRDATDEVERKGTERTERSLELADVTLLILDASQELAEEDRRIIKRLKKEKTLVVLNKCDKKVLITAAKLLNSLNFSDAISVSALTGQGLPEIKTQILAWAGSMEIETSHAPIVTNSRHIYHLEKAQEKIAKALAALNTAQTEESLSIDLREALLELSAITGEEVNEDVLSAIFSKFCIGK